jgi:hypothetical protein
MGDISAPKPEGSCNAGEGGPLTSLGSWSVPFWIVSPRVPRKGPPQLALWTPLCMEEAFCKGILSFLPQLERVSGVGWGEGEKLSPRKEVQL